MLDAYAAAGGNALMVDDVADGEIAQLVGTWLASRKRREQTVLLARVGTASDLTAAGLHMAVDRLLRRLGTDQLDVLVLGATTAPRRWRRR